MLVEETVIFQTGRHRSAISLVRREKHRCSPKVRCAGCSQVFDIFLVRSVVVFNRVLTQGEMAGIKGILNGWILLKKC